MPNKQPSPSSPRPSPPLIDERGHGIMTTSQNAKPPGDHREQHLKHLHQHHGTSTTSMSSHRSLRHRRRRKIILSIFVVCAAVAIIVALSIELTKDDDSNDDCGSCGTLPTNDPCNPNPCNGTGKICTPTVAGDADGEDFVCKEPRYRKQEPGNFTRTSTYMTTLCADEDRRSECRAECGAAECCKIMDNVTDSSTCLSSSSGSNRGENEEDKLASCVAYSACHVVLYNDNDDLNLQGRRQLEDEEKNPPTSTLFVNASVALLNLGEICSLDRISSNRTACEATCRDASCCWLGQYTDLDDYTDCRASHLLLCLDYAPCLNLGHASATNADGSRTITTTALEAAPSNLDELCLSSDESDRVKCQESCDSAGCCVSFDSDRCLKSSFLSCLTYSWCVALSIPPPNTEVPDPPANLHQTCAIERILPSKEDRETCEDACEPASCCIDTDPLGNCFLDDPFGCLEYSQCSLLMLIGGDVSIPNNNITKVCSWDFISSGPGAGSECAEICEASRCCWERGDASCYLDGNFFTCNLHSLCWNLLLEGGDVPDPPENLIETCAWSNLETTEGYKKCYDACEPGFCCVAQAEEDNCFVGNAIACASYLPCWPLGLMGDVLPAPEDIATVCSPWTLENQGSDDCKTICDEASCCSEEGTDSCFEENPVTCLGYLPCANLLATGGQVEDPPLDLATMCNFANILSAEGCAECKCECEKASCCIADGDDNCFADGNAAACTKWVVGCSVLIFGNCNDFMCQGFTTVLIDMPPQIIQRQDVEILAADAMGGRDNDTPGSTEAREYIIDELQKIGVVGLQHEEAPLKAREAFMQQFPSGTNILGLIEGSDLSSEHIILSAHYDHVSTCKSVPNADSDICNGAQDNAVAVALVLGVARAIVNASTPPRRSIVLAFWDREEDFEWGSNGLERLLGSKYYVENPLVPLADTKAVLNWDTIGLNLLPSLRNFHLAMGAETGGFVLQSALADAIQNEVDLDVRKLSTALGLERSDHAHFVDNKVPSIFFSDGTAGCYHSTGDEIKMVDFEKLEKEARIGLKLAYTLAQTVTPPAWKTEAPLTFADVVTIHDMVGLAASDDIDRFLVKDRKELLDLRDLLGNIVAKGKVEVIDAISFALLVPSFLVMLEETDCDGHFL